MKLERSLRLKLRDVLILTLRDVDPSEEEALTQLSANLANVCNIPIIVLREGMTLDSMTEQDMVRAGWMRVERSRNGGDGRADRY